MLADYYADLFEQFGINAKKVITNSAKIRLYALIVEEKTMVFTKARLPILNTIENLL